MNNTLSSQQISSHSVPLFRRKIVILSGILALVLLGGCGSSGDLLTEERQDSLYEAGPMQATDEVSLASTGVLNLNELRNLPEDGNVLKVHTACMDNSTGISYAAGIMSQDIAVIEDGKMTKYFHTGLQGGKIKYLYCDKGYLLIVDERTLISLDPETGKELAQIDSRSAFVPSTGFLDGEEGFFILPESKSKKITIYDASTLEPIHSVAAGKYRTNWFKDGNGNLLALQEDRDGHNIHAFWYDPQTFEEIKTVDLDIPFSTSMDYDSQTDSIWVALGNKLMQFSISGGGAGATLTVPEDVKQVLVEGGRVLVVSENGYDDNKEAGFKGGLLIVDANTGKMEQELALPWQHTEVDARENEAIVTNNDGNSVSIVNLETGDYEVVALGSAAESLAVNEQGTLYIANRLGGSTIVTSDSEELDSLGWPVGLAYSASLDQIFAYNMLGSSVDVIDANSNELLKTYDLGIEDANSDALASSAFDETHNVLFAAVPEFFTVVALDVENGEILKTIALPHEQGAEVDGGLGGVLVGVYEPTMMVYVYSALSGELLRYDGLNDFALLGSETVSVEGLSTYRLALFVDQYHGRVFLGSSVFDAETGKLIGTLPEGPQSVLGIDNERGVLLAVGLKGEEEILYALHADLSSIVDQSTLPTGNSVRATGIYDSKTGKIYVSQMTLGEVWIFDVFNKF